MRKPSQRKNASRSPESVQTPAFGGWRKDLIAAAVAVAALGVVLANAAFLQAGPHPAPLFAAKPMAVAPAQKPIRVVGQEIIGPAPQNATPKSRPGDSEPARADMAKPEPVKLESAERASPRPQIEVIADIQRELARRGFYDGAPDGVFGPKTNAAMRDFEQASALRPGAEPNEVFLRAVTRSQVKTATRSASATTPQSDPISELLAPSSKRIFAIQRALTDYGFGQFRPNGTFGPETKNAIEQFERARKLPVTGQISPRLMRELQIVTGRELD